MRPTVRLANDTDIDPAMIQLMHDCWKENPDTRPDFKQIKSVIRQMNRGRYVPIRFPLSLRSYRDGVLAR